LARTRAQYEATIHKPSRFLHELPQINPNRQGEDTEVDRETMRVANESHMAKIATMLVAE